MKQYRKLYQEYYGVQLSKDWEVHHIDQNRENNSMNNLVALPKNLHKELHSTYNELLAWCRENSYFDITSFRLYSGELNFNNKLMDVLTDYLDVLRKCVPYMNDREFAKMRKENYGNE